MNDNRLINRLDAATIREAEAAVSERRLGATETLRATFIEAHGPSLGPMLFEAQMKARAEAADKVRRLKAQLDVASCAYDLRARQLAERLVPLRASMDEAYAVWLRACEALEAQRIANDAERAPLEVRISELVKEINRPIFRMKQWVPESHTPNRPERDGT